MGLRYGTYGEIHGDGYGFESVGIYGTALWDLWDSPGFMGLRCATYGIYGDLRASGWGPMGFAGVCGIAVLRMRLDRDHSV